MLACASASALLDSSAAWAHAQPHEGPRASGGEVVRLRYETAPVGLGGKRERAVPTVAERRSRLTITVVLKRTDEAGFQRYVRDVENRASPLYRRFLTPAQQAARFGPSRSTYTQNEAWLRSHGLR